MFLQRNSKLVVGCFRPNRKCFSVFNGCLIFLLLLMIALPPQTAARPNQDEDLPPQPFVVSDDFKDVDNLEIHHVKVMDGVEHEDHPIIVYKEDFVTEDYVPPSNGTKAERHKRRSKDIHHRKRHNKQNFTDIVIQEKPETLLFDIIPETPIIVPEDMEKTKTSYLKLEPLVKDSAELDITEDEGNAIKKQELQKRPKKYHQRVRRNANGDHLVRKRNPYFRHVPKIAADTPTQQIQYIYVKHSVAGKKHNGLDIPVPGPRPTAGPNENMSPFFENRIAADENDRVIFSGGRRTTARPTEAPESIFRDPRPQNFDFSFMMLSISDELLLECVASGVYTLDSAWPQQQPEDRILSTAQVQNSQRPATSTARSPIFTRRPQTARPEQADSIFRDPRPENFDFSFMNPQGQSTSFTPARVPAVATASASATTARAQPPTQAAISQCVWAIVNCCSNRNTDIRYNCFEQNGCYGAFWGLNPCADTVRDNLVNFVADYYN